MCSAETSVFIYLSTQLHLHKNLRSHNEICSLWQRRWNIWGVKLSWNVIEQKMPSYPVEHPYVPNEPSEC